MSGLKVTQCLIAGLLLASSYLYAAEEKQDKPDYHVYFSLADKFGSPLKEAQSHFGCSDKIYTVVELKQHPQGKHHLSVKWQDPHGNTREKTEYPFTINQSQSTRLWAWLSLFRATGAGLFKWINPDAGMEDFIGEWRVTVSIDGKAVKQKTFVLNC